MAKFFFLEQIDRKLFLGADDQFTVWSALNPAAIKFNTEEAALTKLSALGKTQDTIRVVAVGFPEIPNFAKREKK